MAAHTLVETRGRMKYQAGEYEAVHQSPIWRDRANFAFAAHLGMKAGKKEWEQLWGQKVAPQRLIVCCIPFFVYDVALGDEVEIDADLVLQRDEAADGMVFRKPARTQRARGRGSAACRLLVCAGAAELASVRNGP